MKNINNIDLEKLKENYINLAKLNGYKGLTPLSMFEEYKGKLGEKTIFKGVITSKSFINTIASRIIEIYNYCPELFNAGMIYFGKEEDEYIDIDYYLDDKENLVKEIAKVQALFILKDKIEDFIAPILELESKSKE